MVLLHLATSTPCPRQDLSYKPRLSKGNPLLSKDLNIRDLMPVDISRIQDKDIQYKVLTANIQTQMELR
jgi:hypothetical protein